VQFKYVVTEEPNDKIKAVIQTTIDGKAKAVTDVLEVNGDELIQWNTVGGVTGAKYFKRA